MSEALGASHLTRRFGDVPGILDLSLSVEQGEVFGFLGANGSGKSTTIRLLLDLLRPDDGEARILGQEVRAGGGALRSHVGFLPGDLAFPPGLRGQAALDLLQGLQGRPSTQRDDVLDRLGFPRAALNRAVKTYSKGMRQAIGIAMAFQHTPQVLILDEPTNGLDPVVRDAFLELVRDRAASGATVFLSSHVLDEVERCADRVGFLAKARLRLVESVATLRAKRPRTVRLRYAARGADAPRQVDYTTSDPPEALLAAIDRTGLEEVEIRAASLDEVFRAVAQGEDDDA